MPTRVPRNSRLLGALPFLALIIHQVNFLVGKGRNVVLEQDPRNLEASKSQSAPRIRPNKQHFESAKQRHTGTNSILSSKNWWDDQVSELAIPFQPWNGTTYSWCLEHSSDDASNTGLLFTKTSKTGSSKAVALSRQIAHQVGKRHLINSSGNGDTQNQTTSAHCKLLLQDEFRPQNRHRSHWQTPFLLWTIVHDPAKRAESDFKFFHRGRKGTLGTTNAATTEDKMIRYFQGQKNAMIQQVRVVTTEKNPISDDVLRSHRILTKLLREEIFHAYDFVAVSERWDESVAVMKLLFDLEDQDIILLSNRSSGRWTLNHFHSKAEKREAEEEEEEKCVLLPQAAPVTKENHRQITRVEEYLHSNFTVDNADFLLHATASRSLDLTIDALGRDRVTEQVQWLRHLQQLVDRNCFESTQFPCSLNGTWQPEAQLDCYFRNMGCGYKCVHRVLDQQKMGLLSQSS